MEVTVEVIQEQVVVLPDETVVVVEEKKTATVEVGIAGPQGPPGPAGPPGPGSTTGLLRVEALAGSIDGLNVDFGTSVPYLPGSTTVYLNGLAQEEPGDYNEMSSTTVRFVDAPQPGDTVRVSYQEV